MSKKNLPLSLLFILFFTSFSSAASFPLVDGQVNPSQVVITGRSPIFSFEYTNAISSFTIIVSSDSETYEPSGELWNLEGATSTANTSNGATSLTTRAVYAGTTLDADTTYYFQVSIFDGILPASATGQFVTTASAEAITGTKMDLLVDWNNPFNPSAGQYTVLRYTSADKDRTVRLRIYNVAGELVIDWPERSIMRGAVYTQNWNGRSNDGDVVARGIYFVNLMDVTDNTGVTKRLFVIK
jgi:hypothetical protein